RRRRARRPHAHVKKLLALLAAGALLGGGFAYVNSTEPGWYVRLRYPLRYDAIVRGHARNYRLDPALLAGVIYHESKFRAHARSRPTTRGRRPSTAGAPAVQESSSPSPATTSTAWST